MSSAPAIAAGSNGPTAAVTPLPLTPARTPTPTPEPTPPDFLAAPGQIEAPKNLGFVSLPTDELGTFVYCVYGRAADANAGLVTLVVKPPVVQLGSAARDLVESVQFRPEIEVNSLEGVFSSDWSSLTRGRSQKSEVVDLVALFKEQRVKVNVRDLPPSAVLRVAVVLTWVDPSGERFATQRLYPTAYAPLGDESTEPIAEGCPARN